jgi:hypothetical protein
MKAYRRSRSVGPVILNLGARWKVSGHYHAPGALLPGRNIGRN